MWFGRGTDSNVGEDKNDKDGLYTTDSCRIFLRVFFFHSRMILFNPMHATKTVTLCVVPFVDPLVSQFLKRVLERLNHFLWPNSSR